jgi:HAD superfamily hydrolase (TIGR01484 family)
MRFFAVATDYDGTLARDGRPDAEALEALRQLRKSGRRSIIVTGRLLSDLQAVFDELELVDAVVAENGAVLYDTARRKTTAIAQPPPPEFVEALRAKKVSPLDVGEAIVSTWHPHEETVLQTIRELGLDLTVIFNKGAVMVLPSSVNKATGLTAQLELMGFSLHNVAGIGDAENDLAFLVQCEASAATANALESVKSACDLVTTDDHGRGVAEFIARIVADDLADIPSIDARHAIALGETSDGERISISAVSGGVLLAGTSGGGKTTLVTGFIERLSAQDYQVCVVDPEGDYGNLPGVLSVGDAQSTPSMEQLADVIDARKSTVVSLLAVAESDRPAFAHRLFARLAEFRASCGRPHWLIVDEAHHALPAQSETLAPIDLGRGTLFVTTHPALVSARALAQVEVVIAVGDAPEATIASARQILGAVGPAVSVGIEHAHSGTAVVWRRTDPARAFVITTIPGTTERRRHVRKYAQGELAPEKSFFFTGPNGRQNLRAYNLMIFAQLADGVDDETWEWHLKRHDYSRWARDAIGDDELVAAARHAEDDASLATRASRDVIIAAIRERYTAPG